MPRDRHAPTPSHAAGLTRRTFLAAATAVGAAAVAGRALAEDAADLPRVDLHVHLDNSTIDKVAALGRERGVKFGIVEHAGTKENIYPVVLSNDDELRRYLKMLEGKGVWRGVQTEWNDWMKCFSREALAELDYVLTDAMTFPGKDGRRVKLWDSDVEARVEMSDKQSFMDRLVDWNVAILSQQPIDILANVSWLPAPLAPQYDALWTEARVRKVVAAAVKYKVALEISASYKLPSQKFCEIAKAAGVKFSFGSNGRYPNMGKLDHSLAMAKTLGLTKADLFTPAAPGKRAVNWRKY
jgi:histidinol phosphatase-like PHP family hydrolase